MTDDETPGPLVPTRAAGDAAEHAQRVDELRKARGDRIAAALSAANEKTGLFKPTPTFPRSHPTQGEPTIMPPWPDLFMTRMMEAIAPFEGRPMSRTTEAQMAGALYGVVQHCIADETLSPAATVEGPLEDGTLLVHEPGLPSFTMTPSNQGPARDLPWQPGPSRQLPWAPAVPRLPGVE